MFAGRMRGDQKIMADCLFCKIANKEMPTSLTYEDDLVVAFNDIYPKAPIHQLIVPKKHIATINDLSSADEALVGRLFIVAAQLAKQHNIAERGYRVLMNCNQEGGQIIYHMHLHLLGGKQL